MTDIGVFSQPFQSEDRSWLLSEFEDLYAEGFTLSVAAFTAGTHYPNGFIPSGTALGIITASGLVGPYTSGAADGTQTCIGLLVSSIRVLDPVGVARTKVGIASTRFNAVVSQARLPFQSGAGSVDTAAKTALKNVLFLA